MPGDLAVRPIGVIHTTATHPRIVLDPLYTAGLLGLDAFSHILVLYWLHHNDDDAARATLRVHPRADERNPLTGVFATHSPKRPNPVAVSRCRLLSVDGNVLVLEAIDAFDRSPVIDIKSYIPDPVPADDLRQPAWVAGHGG